MFNYKIGYSWEEGSGYIELSNLKQFSKEELEEIIIEVSLRVLIEERKKSPWLDWFEEGDRDESDIYDIYSSFNDILDQVIEILIKDYGFEKIKYEQIIELPGLTGVISPENNYEEKNWCGYNIRIFEEIRKRYCERKNEKKRF